MVAVTSARSAPAAVLAPLTWAAGTVRAMPWVAKGVETLAGARRGQLLVALRSVGITVGLLVVFGLLFASADRVFARMMPRVEVGPAPGPGRRRRARGRRRGGARAPRARTAQLVRRPARTAAGRDARRVAPPGARARRDGPAVRDGPGRRAARRPPPRAGDRGPHLRRVRAGGFRPAGGRSPPSPSSSSRSPPGAHPARPRGTGCVSRLALGALCVGTLGVVASALRRMDLYVDAFGLTRLRVFVTVTEIALAAVFVLLLVAGIRWRGGWLPRAVLQVVGVAMLGLAAPQPGRADRPPQHHGRPGHHPRRRLPRRAVRRRGPGLRRDRGRPGAAPLPARVGQRRVGHGHRRLEPRPGTRRAGPGDRAARHRRVVRVGPVTRGQTRTGPPPPRRARATSRSCEPGSPGRARRARRRTPRPRTRG